MSNKLILLLTAVLWSTSGLFIKIIDWHPMAIAGSRSLLAASFIIVSGGFLSEKGKLELKKAAMRPAFYLCAAAYSATMISFVAANKMTNAANVILLQYSAPIWTALLGYFLIKEKPRIYHLAAMPFVFFGMFLFFKNSAGGGTALGNALAIFSGIAFGANSVFMRMQKNENPAAGMLGANILTACIGIPFLFKYMPAFSAGSILAICFMGFFQIGLASLLFSIGIKKISAISAMLIFTVEPVINPVWVFAVTGESPSLNALIGGGIIVLAALAANISENLKNKNNAAAKL
jgi:drug/metabolite transporter (DMT)-like permease